MDYLEYLVKSIPERQRAISGLSLKLVYLRLKGQDEEETKIKLEKYKNMTDEEYEEYKIRSKNG